MIIRVVAELSRKRIVPDRGMYVPKDMGGNANGVAIYTYACASKRISGGYLEVCRPDIAHKDGGAAERILLVAPANDNGVHGFVVVACFDLYDLVVCEYG